MTLRAMDRFDELAFAGVNPVRVRSAAPTDQAFIASTFIQSLALVETPLTPRQRGLLVDAILDKAGVRIQVACDSGDANKIYGWLCYSPMPHATVLHYGYVRNQMRRRGIGDLLAEVAGLRDGRPVVFTLRGPASAWLEAKHPGAQYMPVGEFLA